MSPKKISPDKIDQIKTIYSQALVDIRKIKKERDEKIKEILKSIDTNQITNILKDIRGTK
ncbi:MAG TPA: hypothetical protein PLP70_01405 [bacterium]|jgi:ArsR family metal-binding transcriptional regulator|nr:hypothetical protein [bacterium]HPX64800.1 hypothetical protein [bacterium]HQB26496.1 hypothetical protein [bacterium]